MRIFPFIVHASMLDATSPLGKYRTFMKQKSFVSIQSNKKAGNFASSGLVRSTRK